MTVPRGKKPSTIITKPYYLVILQLKIFKWDTSIFKSKNKMCFRPRHTNTIRRDWISFGRRPPKIDKHKSYNIRGQLVPGRSFCPIKVDDGTREQCSGRKIDTEAGYLCRCERPWPGVARCACCGDNGSGGVRNY